MGEGQVPDLSSDLIATSSRQVIRQTGRKRDH
jgi:hypothetical protein